MPKSEGAFMARATSPSMPSMMAAMTIQNAAMR